MDPGTGKSKLIIDTAAYLYEHDKINALLIAAPNSVDEQWCDQEIPRHLPPRIARRVVCWDSGSMRARRLARELSSHPLPNRLTVLAINHEAFATKGGREVVAHFLRRYRTLFVVDEAHAIKTHTAQRTRHIIRLGKDAPVRRTLTGTPITKNPLDLFSQFEFLDERIIGFGSFIAFSHEYADFTTEWVQRYNPRTQESVPQSYEVLQGFKNLDQLYTRLDPYIFRQSKADCLDLPPKMYSILPVPLSPAQLALYTKVKEDAIVLLSRVEQGEPLTSIEINSLALDDADDAGVERELVDRLQDSVGRLTAKIKLVALLRARQIVGGYVKTDAGEVLCIDGTPNNNPRLRAAMTWLDGVLQSNNGKIIIWARFRPELEAINQAILSRGEQCLLIYGGVNNTIRREGIKAFKDRSNPLRIMVTHEQSMGVGMDFNMASDMLFYSCSHSYYQRAQAEDRAHRIGQLGTVTITDLHARDVEIDRSMAEARAQAEAFKTDFMQWNLSTSL
jgi:SNF2 family DNA or RNA helicase